MSSQKYGSLQALIKKRQREEFVGREDQIAFFDRNLSSPLDTRSVVINISGQGGIGKSHLLRRYRQLAEAAGAVTALVNEAEEDVPTVLGRIADQFATQGHTLKSLAERYKTYRQRHQELESDPEVPKGITNVIGRSIAKTGVHLARRAPGVGVAFEFVDEEALAAQAGEWMAYVARKITNKDEVQLVQKPIEVLTPLFVEELKKVGDKHPIALFFDTYEKTSISLDSWLRDILDGRYGELSPDIIITIAGQHELDKNAWAQYEGVIARFQLELFTEDETREYLNRKGITNDTIISTISRLSGRLPLLVTTLAQAIPTDPESIGDPSGTAIERFLKWVNDPDRKRVALDAAIPRYLNRDIVAVLTGEESADKLFAWLTDMPFVSKATWKYHDVVRDQMLRYKQRESPSGWSDLHGQFAAFFEKLRDSLTLDDQRKYSEEVWQDYSVEALYHRLCQDPHKQILLALNGFLLAYKENQTFAQKWARSIRAAGNDSNVEELRTWGYRLLEGIEAVEGKQQKVVVELFTTLLSDSRLEPTAKAIAHNARGNQYLMQDYYEQAITDFAQAVTLAPESAMYLRNRARAFSSVGCYENAIGDLDRAIQLESTPSKGFRLRGSVHLKFKRFNKALQDFNQALELEQDYELALQERGRVYREIGRFQEAIADFERTLEIEPANAHILHKEIGLTLRAAGNSKAAAENFRKALEVSPICSECWRHVASACAEDMLESEAIEYLRGISISEDKRAFVLPIRADALRVAGFLEEALSEFSNALTQEGNLLTVLKRRAILYRKLKRYDEALEDSTKALELDPRSGSTYGIRGDTFSTLGQHEKAVNDYKMAMEMDRGLEHQTLMSIGQAYLKMRRFSEALVALEKSLTVSPTCSDCWGLLISALKEAQPKTKILARLREVKLCNSNLVLASRAEAMRRAGFHEDALSDLREAIEHNQTNDVLFYERAQLYRDTERYAEALTDYTRALELNEFYTSAYYGRGHVFASLHRHDEAVADFTKVISVWPTYPYPYIQRANSYMTIGKHTEALRDFDFATQKLRPEDEDLRFLLLNKGLLLSYLQRYEDSMRCYEEGSKLGFEGHELVYNKAVVMTRWKGLSSSKDLIADAENAMSKRLKSNGSDFLAIYGLAGLSALKGDTEKALRYLGKAIHSNETARDWARQDIAWLDLRNDRRFTELVSIAS